MRIQIEHRIGVQVPAAEAWRHLSDLESWGTWSVMYPKASGRLQIGAPLTLTEVIPGDEPQDLTAQVVDWVPNAQIIWTLKAGRFLRRIRYFELQTLTDEGCGARYVSKDLKRAMRRGFTDMGEAFKAMVERGSAAPRVASAAAR
jgi:hypothetical protein